jgi:hypothetical protein
VAYLAGAESQDTFNPLSYGQACSKGGCHTVTEGYLSKSGADVTWDSRVPLGQPFTVRVPVWAWGTGRNLIYGDGDPIAMMIVGLFLEGWRFRGMAVLLVFVLLAVLGHGRSRRRQGTIVPASAAPHGSRPPHHPPICRGTLLANALRPGSALRRRRCVSHHDRHRVGVRGYGNRTGSVVDLAR